MYKYDSQIYFIPPIYTNIYIISFVTIENIH